jgi:hypothetical protein
MTGLSEPVDPGLATALRATALELRDRRRGRRFPAEVSVGRLGRPPHARPWFEVPAHEVLDLALRTEIVGALLQVATDREQVPVACLARPGALTWHDLDAQWWPAFHAAYAEAEVPLVAVVVTKNGWWDPRSGLRREWRRLRFRTAERPVDPEDPED